MVIHIVRFRSALPDERIAELFQIRASEYLACPRAAAEVLPALPNRRARRGVRLGLTPRRWSGSWRAD